MNFRLIATSVFVLACAVMARAADWRVLLSEPAGLGQRLPRTESGIDDGILNLGNGEQLVCSVPDYDVIVLVNGPAVMERSSNGDLLIIRQGSVAVASEKPVADQFFEVAIEGPDKSTLLRSTVPQGTLYARAAGNKFEIAVQSTGPWTPSETPAEPLTSGVVFTSKDATWAATEISAQSLAQSAGLDIRAATAKFGVQSARRDQLDVQQKLVVNLLAIDQQARGRTVGEQIRPQSELRVVTIGSSQSAVVAVSQSGTQAGLVPGQQSNFLNLTFPGVGSPSSLALGNQGAVDFLRQVAEGRAAITGGQGLGTGGLFSLGVVGLGPGGLLGGRR